MPDNNHAEGVASQTRPPGRQAHIEWASTIRPERQIWLWENRIPVGTVSALAGRGGTGKTTYALHLAAQLSRGTLPGQHHGTPRPTLIWSGEDAWGPVLVPRLLAARADMGMVGRLGISSTVTGGEVTPLLPLDADTFRDAITASGAALVIIDPIASTMTGDLHREADVRAAVDALARLAADTSAVVMFVRHFGKGAGNPSDKMSGSHAFRDAVRSVFLFAEDEGRVVVSQDKGNYAPPGAESFAFRLENTSVPTDDGPAEVARVIDLGASDTSVGDIINRTPDHDDDERTAAAHWLEDYLTANGPTPSKVIKTDAAKEKITERTLQRAKQKLGVLDRSSNFPRVSTWELPSGATSQLGHPHTQERGATGATEPDQVKRDGATEPDSQSRHTPESGATGGATAPSPAAMPTKIPAATPKPGRERHRTIRGIDLTSYPECPVCHGRITSGQGGTHLSCSKQQVAS
ncbi:hypothetical protein MycrhDRAFT_1974 [Mycolicibacterium rhodesiae JS60]|nr:hypothetical protein MycrhDRAFT_1974 [Mycolicibacterium rhodesiae JS60]